MSLTFESPTDGQGVELSDAAERHHYALETPTPVTPEPVSADRIDAPIDDAILIEAAGVALPNVVAVYVRDDDRQTVAEAEHFADIDLPRDRYTVELAAPVKTYLQVDAPVRVTADAERTELSFGEETEILVGARSRDEQPEYTVTTTEDPEDMMRAVSALGSALKETSPERSYPTLRGHPALIELGDDLDIPAEMSVPDTGVQVEIPPERRYVYVAAPLAFYLGAELVPGEKPRLVADGFTHPLTSARGFEAEVERTLKQVFFLDCCVRTEGLYRVDLSERRAVEDIVDFEMAEVYDAPIAEQLEAYLSVPYEDLAAHMPEWKLTTHLTPDPGSVELLPFVLDDLAVVRLPQTREPTGTEAQAAAIEEFVRDGGFTRSAGTVTGPDASPVHPSETNSLEQAWAGDGAPLGASKPTVDAFKNRLDRRPSDGDIDITVVCNDTQMVEERDIVGEVYGERERLPFDVEVHHELTVEDLREVIAGNADFLHYIGHIDDDGFECADGKLDAQSLDEVGVDAFFLNACQSYDQGMALIEAGSIGGVVTLREVVNSGAVAVGSTLARLLNRGFPLRTGLEVARDESAMGHQYVVVGDGGISVAQTESGVALLCELEELEEGYEFTIHTYPTESKGMGTMFLPFLEGVDCHYLSAGELDSFEVGQEELLNLLALENYPVRVDGELRWSSNMLLEMF